MIFAVVANSRGLLCKSLFGIVLVPQSIDLKGNEQGRQQRSDIVKGKRQYNNSGVHLASLQIEVFWGGAWSRLL